MSFVNKDEYMFDKVYAYCAYMITKGPLAIKEECGFDVLIENDKIIILDGESRKEVYRCNIEFVSGYKELDVLKEKADALFKSCEEDELMPMQMMSYSEFVEWVIKTNAGSVHGHGYDLYQIVWGRDKSRFTFYESCDGSTNILKVSYNSGEKIGYIIHLCGQVKAYAVGMTADDILRMCGGLSPVDCK